jgi:hypothetical protein
MKIDENAMVNLKIGGKQYQLQVRRLVQCTFSTNPYNKPRVIHKTGNILDFSLDNLVWVTCKESRTKAKPSDSEKTSKRGNRPVIKWRITEDKEKGEPIGIL